MSRIFGPIMQNGYVVDDLARAVKHWTEVLGVGPFFWLPSVTFEYYHYWDELTEPELQVAMANSGGLQIQLIQQVNSAPSFYRDFLIEHGPGLQHLSVWSRQYTADLQRYAAMGLRCLSDGVVAPARTKFSMYDTNYYAGAAMEVLEYNETIQDHFRIVRDAAADWDGKDPVRSLES